MAFLKPLGNDLLIHPIDDPVKSKGGIIVPDSSRLKRRVDQGLIVAKGPLVNEELQIGDHVLYNGYTGDKVSVEDSGIMHIVPDDFIIAIMTESVVSLVDTETMKRLIIDRILELKAGDNIPHNYLESIEEDLLERLDSLVMSEGFE